MTICLINDWEEPICSGEFRFARRESFFEVENVPCPRCRELRWSSSNVDVVSYIFSELSMCLNSSNLLLLDARLVYLITLAVHLEAS